MLKIKLSNRARQTPPSPIRSLAHLADRAKNSGIRVFHLNIGQPDIPSPQEFFDGVRMYKEKVLAYDQSQGNEMLCRSWSAHMNRSLNLTTSPEQFLITMGASEALVFLFMTCCDPGDEIVIFDPSYANYMGFAAVTGVNLIPIPSDLEHNFALPTREEFEHQITNRTRAVLLCSPNNPTGTVYSREDLIFLLALCEEHNIFLIVDETYREYVYDGLEPLSILHIAPNNNRVIVVDSLSKRYSLCGARIGALITPNEEVIQTTLKIAQARLAAPTIEQFAAAHMLCTVKDDYVSAVRQKYQRRRDTLYEQLRQIDGLNVHKPRGAFYTVARLPVENAEAFARYLLMDFRHNGKTTFVAPGAGFYMHNSRGRQNIRIAYVLDDADIIEAVEVISRGLESFKRLSKNQHC